MISILTLLSIVGLLVVLLLAHTLYRAVLRRRHAIPAPGIDEAGLVCINGIRQYLQIRGKNPANPVLLVLHGGPGSPLSAMAHSFQYAWEEDYTVVQWDQRQSGKTYFAGDEQAVAPTLNFATVLEDAFGVIQYLRQRFGVQKVAVMGHSWGTVLGTALAQTHPEVLSCYIGVGQVTNLQDNERMGYEEAVKRARAAGNEQDIAALAALESYPGSVFSDAFCKQMLTVRRYQQKYKLAETITVANVLMVLLSPYYSFREGMYYTKDATVLHRPLYRYMFEQYDARSFGTDYQLPVYYIMGQNDYQTPVPLAQALFAELTAPAKKFYLIPDAGHFTMHDNAPAFNKALLGEIRASLQ